MAGTDRIYRFYCDEGHREYEPLGPGSGIITTYGAATFSENDRLTVIGWSEEALRMCGATRVEPRSLVSSSAGKGQLGR